MKKMLLLFCVIPFLGFSQNKKIDTTHVDLSNPNATVYTHYFYLQQKNFNPNLAAKTIYNLPEKTAAKKAVRLKKILDGKGLSIDFSKIPSNEDYVDSVGYNAYNQYFLFPERMPTVYVEKIEGKWYYSEETIAKIDDLYEEVFPWYVASIDSIVPAWGYRELLNVKIWQYIALIVLIILSILVFVIFRIIALFILRKLQQQITRIITYDI
ncbi:hypothetical protein N9V96_03090, partial [Polaribacter sp.]|nr:hypothetical protein [Polaribacter sp.]